MFLSIDSYCTGSYHSQSVVIRVPSKSFKLNHKKYHNTVLHDVSHFL